MLIIYGQRSAYLYLYFKKNFFNTGNYSTGQTKTIKLVSELWCLMPLPQYFSYIWWSVLLVEETGEPGENYRPATSH